MTQSTPTFIHCEQGTNHTPASALGLFIRCVNGTIPSTRFPLHGLIPLGYLKLATKLLGAMPGARAMDKRISAPFDRLIDEKIEGHYDESNKELEALIGMDLKPFEYFR